MAFVPPEMIKYRQVVVISDISFNHRRAVAPGTCSVIPFSTVTPSTIGPEDIFIPVGSYRSLNKDSWIRCKMIANMSHDRLGLPHGVRGSEFMTLAHMAEIERALRLVLVLP